MWASSRAMAASAIGGGRVLGVVVGRVFASRSSGTPSAFRSSRAIRRIGFVLDAAVERGLDNRLDVANKELDGVVGIGDVASFGCAEGFYVRLEIRVVAFGEEGAGRVLAKTGRCLEVDEVVRPF